MCTVRVKEPCVTAVEDVWTQFSACIARKGGTTPNGPSHLLVHVEDPNKNHLTCEVCFEIPSIPESELERAGFAIRPISGGVYVMRPVTNREIDVNDAVRAESLRQLENDNMALDPTRPLIFRYADKPSSPLAPNTVYIPVLPCFESGKAPHFTGASH